MDIGEIKARIAELEQRKAERNAMRGYRDLSYIDYMVKGDRSGFDKIEADEVAYRNMLKQQAQQERLLGLQQTQQDKMLAAQQDFTARENELNRKNALEISKQNKAEQEQYRYDQVQKSLNDLVITRETLAAEGKDTRGIDAQIEQIHNKYPELKPTINGSYNPRQSVDYKLSKYSSINSKNTNSDDIQSAIDDLVKFNTPQSAKRIAELELELENRIKYEESDAYIKDLIKAFDVNTGDLDPALANKGYESKHATGGKFKLVKDGKVIKSYSGKKSQSWD